MKFIVNDDVIDPLRSILQRVNEDLHTLWRLAIILTSDVGAFDGVQISIECTLTSMIKLIFARRFKS